jgi:hypothetical protein
MSLICRSISLGWSPTGTLVKPGKSTKVSVRTLGEYIRKLIGAGEIPTLRPALASVSFTISSRILLKSKNFWPGRWRNSPHSSTFACESVLPCRSLSDTPFVCNLAGIGLWMSWRTRGRRVTIPAPRGRLQGKSVIVGLRDGLELRLWRLTNLYQRCSPVQRTFH